MDKCDSFIEQSHEAILAAEKSRRRKIAVAICALLVFIAGLSIFSGWAMSEKQEADLARQNAETQERIANEQKDFAVEQQQKAEEQKRKAELANQYAEQQRDSARIMYQRAMVAKLESERERLNAETNARIAEEQRENAERERQNALHQMELTNEANDNAARLYYVALCNTLAMKAKNQYEDKTLNLRLAKTACEMNLKGGGDTKKNADLYDAMLFAMEENKIIEPLNISGGPFKAFAIDPAGCIVTIADDGTIAQHRIASNGSTEPVTINNTIVNKTPIESAAFVTPSLIVVSTKDHRSLLLNLANNNITRLPNINDYIYAASPSPDHQKCAVGYINGNVVIIDTNGNAPENEHDFKTNITDVYYHNNDNIYVLCHDGSLLKWTISSNNVKTILPPNTRHKAFKMAAVNDKNLLAVCYSDGDMQFVDLATDQKGSRMTGGHSKLENMLYDPASGILALSSADKRIALINTNDLNEKPLVIEEHCLNNHRIKCMGFNNKGVLFALTDDNKMRLWDTDPTTYADALAAMSLSPLSDSEWNLIVGREFSER